MRIFLVTGAAPLALALAYLGVKTAQDNLLGWFLALSGFGYLAGGAVYLFIRRESQPREREERGDRSFWLILPGFLAVFYGPPLETLYLPESLPRNLSMQLVGLALILLAILLRLWTRRTIGRFYSGHLQVQSGHRLVQDGPYRWIRHPGYAGFLLMALGLSLGYSSLIGLFSIPLLLLPGLAFRMKVEESLLVEQFAEEYDRYARRTKRLIPGIW